MAYREFVKEGLQSRPWDELTGQIYLGSEGFIEEHACEAKDDTEIPPVQLHATRPSLQQIFVTRGKNAIKEAYTNHGYRMKEIAEHLRVHYATVSRRLKKLEEKSQV